MKTRNFFGILAVSSVLAGYSAWTRPAHRDPIVPDEAVEAPPPGAIGLLRFADAERLWQTGVAVFLDVRSPFDYEVGHIPGALNVPEDQLEDAVSGVLPQLQKAPAVVVYCKSADCGKSLWASLRLRDKGLRNVLIYPSGWNDWFVRGQPVARSKT